MRFSIGHRLFFAIALSIALVGCLGLGLVRWRLFGHGSDTANAAMHPFIDDFATLLERRYSQHHDWSFLPADAPARKAWVNENARRVQADEATRGAPTSAAIEYRIGVLDVHGQPLAGAFAHPLVIAFASIDSIDRDVIDEGRIVGHVRVASTPEPDDALAVAFLIDQQHNLAIIAACAVLASALAAIGLAAHFRRPIARLATGAQRLEIGQFDARLATRRSDELGDLARVFDRLGARLEAADTSRRQWVADTSHELRTPLAVLRGQLEALQDGVRPATPEHIGVLLRQVATLTKLVDALFALADADAGQLVVESVAFDAWPLVLETMHVFDERFHRAGLQIVVIATQGNSRVKGDPDLLRQVLTNLFENCVRYTDAGGRVEVRGEIHDGGFNIVIDDSAPDVPAHALAHLGERFFRVDASRSRATGGARGWVSRWRGDSSMRKALASNSHRRPSAACARPSHCDGKADVSASILIVEDEADLASIIADYVTAAGHAAEIISDGRSALDRVRVRMPDLIVLDLMLPGVDGLSVCQQVRVFSDVPIVMVTARVEEIDRLLGLQAGADDYVCKPFSPRELVARIAAILRRCRPDEALRRIEINAATLGVRIDGSAIPLTPTEFSLFAALARRPGVILSRAQLLDVASGDSIDVSDRAIDSHIKNLRRKIAAVLPNVEIIHSVYGLGYRVEIESG